MVKKYGVYDSELGITIVVDTEDEAVELFWKKMIKFSYPFFHNTSYVSIDYNDDGTEIWYNDNNNVIDKILTKEEKLNLIELSKTKVEDIFDNE